MCWCQIQQDVCPDEPALGFLWPLVCGTSTHALKLPLMKTHTGRPAVGHAVDGNAQCPRVVTDECLINEPALLACCIAPLCVYRNLVGGAGPVAVAKLAEVVGLQHAMLLAPACYVVSGLIFLIAEKEIEQQQKQEKLAQQQHQQLAVEPVKQ